MTKQDLLDVLRGHPNAEEAIFWWAYAWHSGEGSDLYKIMCESQYAPDPQRKWRDDPAVIECIEKLDAVFMPLVEHDYKLVAFKDVQEGQILIAGQHFPCLPNRWPCRVYRWHGALGVECNILHGVKLAPGSERPFHPLVEDAHGNVEGFRR